MAGHISVGITKNDLKRVAWSALFAFLGTFLALATGMGNWHNFNDAKAAVLALIPAALAAALSAVKNGLLADSSSLKG